MIGLFQPVEPSLTYASTPTSASMKQQHIAANIQYLPENVSPVGSRFFCTTDSEIRNMLRECLWKDFSAFAGVLMI